MKAGCMGAIDHLVLPHRCVLNGVTACMCANMGTLSSTIMVQWWFRCARHPYTCVLHATVCLSCSWTAREQLMMCILGGMPVPQAGRQSVVCTWWDGPTRCCWRLLSLIHSEEHHRRRPRRLWLCTRPPPAPCARYY